MPEYPTQDSIDKYWDKGEYKYCINNVFKAMRKLKFDIIKLNRFLKIFILKFGLTVKGNLKTGHADKTTAYISLGNRLDEGITIGCSSLSA